MLKTVGGFAFLLAFLWILGGACGEVSERADRKPAAGIAETTTTAVQEWNSIPGDGTYKMGGVDGKDWGTYTAPAPAGCSWSVRSVAPYRSADVLVDGSGGVVDIEPDGDVSSLTGMIGDHRIVFVTSGCGVWRRS